MRERKLKRIILEYLPNIKCKLGYHFDRYDSVLIILPDGGEISVAIDPKSRKISFDFLHFNIRNSSIRLSVSNDHNGKYNYFGNDSVNTLRKLLVELKEKLK